MSKFTLVFLFALLTVCLVSGNRIVRDAPASETGTPANLPNFEDIQKFIENTFSQDQLNKIGEGIRNTLEKLNVQGQQLLDSAKNSLQAKPAE